MTRISKRNKGKRVQAKSEITQEQKAIRLLALANERIAENEKMNEEIEASIERASKEMDRILVERMWHDGLKEVHELLGGGKKADQYLTKIVRGLYVEQSHNLTPTPNAKKSSRVFKNISKWSEKLALQLDELHFDNRFSLELEISKIPGDPRSPGTPRTPGSSHTLGVPELIETLAVFQTAAMNAAKFHNKEGRPKGINLVDFTDDRTKAYLSIPDDTKTLSFAPKESFIWQLVNEYHLVFRHRPAYKRTSKFIKAIEILLELAGFSQSGLEPIVNKMNLYLEKAEGPPKPINPWPIKPPT